MIVDDETVNINYSFNASLEKFIKKRIKIWHPDYASIVILNKKGKILSLIGYNREIGFNRYLPFTNMHPAASLFKIVTASSLLERGVSINQKVAFKGKGTTLYKYQFKKIKSKRWIRHQTFKDAFAKSNNVVMGKLAINNLSIFNISNMANRFYFNQFLFDDYKLSKSNYKVPVDNYSLAEISSGFNRSTLISTIHAAIFSQIAINRGNYSEPYFVDHFTRKSKLYSRKIKQHKVLSMKVGDRLLSIMERTLYKGTARKHFFRLWLRNKDKYQMGGKTGSIKGGIPFGKNDWFTFFIKNKESGDGIVIATLLINKKKWYVKSTQLTKEIVGYILKNKLI